MSTDLDELDRLHKAATRKGSDMTMEQLADGFDALVAITDRLPSLIAEIRELRGAMGRVREKLRAKKHQHADLTAWGDGVEYGLDYGIDAITMEIIAAKETP